MSIKAYTGPLTRIAKKKIKGLFSLPYMGLKLFMHFYYLSSRGRANQTFEVALCGDL